MVKGSDCFSGIASPISEPGGNHVGSKDGIVLECADGSHFGLYIYEGFSCEKEGFPLKCLDQFDSEDDQKSEDDEY